LACFVFFINGCGGGSDGGGTGDTGSIAISVTDAKPLLPGNVTNLFVEFTEVWVHKAGEGWKQLALVESPYTIDLLQFQDGNTTQLVPPTELDSGKYTQVRIAVKSAKLRLNNDPDTDRMVEIPSENLKTDKNFTLNISDGTAIDMVIHFDLSKSVIVTGSDSYRLKPVLHLFEDPMQAVIIAGSIDNASFNTSASVTIIAQSNGEVYTQVEVVESTDADPTLFSIFWIAPEQGYTVEIDLDQDGESDCVEDVDLLEEGELFSLNGGATIMAGDGICLP
jgi:hypothetical protein